MMRIKIVYFLMIVILYSCGGSLSDEQRRQMREKMEENRIVRITDAEITEAAFSEGRKVVNELDKLKGDSVAIDSIIENYNGQVRFIKPGESTVHLLEQQLIDAYLADPSGSFRDNVQEVRNSTGDFDTLLYTKPVTNKMEDGTDVLVGIWNIWLPKRELVRAIGRKQ